MSRRFRILPLVAAALTVASAIHAQVPERPTVPRGADPNDWETYFDLGDRVFQRNPRQAIAAFSWASRLDPSRAEPFFARWAAYYGNDQGWWIGYLTEDSEILRRPAVIQNDSLLLWAYRRNPFVHRGLEVGLYAMLGRQLRWDGAMVAFREYGEGDFREAAQRFGAIVRGNPGRNVRGCCGRRIRNGWPTITRARRCTSTRSGCCTKPAIGRRTRDARSSGRWRRT